MQTMQTETVFEPPLTPGRKRNFSIVLTEELDSRLDRISQRTGESRSGIIRAAIREHLRKKESAPIPKARYLPLSEVQSNVPCSLLDTKQPEQLPHPQGQALLKPVLAVVCAANEDKLPATCPVQGTEGLSGELNAEVCRIAAGILYGQTLSDPNRLAAHLDYLTRLQDWFQESEEPSPQISIATPGD